MTIPVPVPPPDGGGNEAVEVIVDNQDGEASRTGTWQVSSGAAPWDGESLYSTETAATFRWTPPLAAGTYAVYAWWTYHANRSTTVPYRIRHGGGTTTVTVNQRQAALGGQWNLLGTFTFAAGSSGYVEVSGAQGQASADAVWLDPAPPPDSGGNEVAEVIVDNQDGEASRTGAWQVSSGAAPWDGESLYSTGTDATFRWTPPLPTTGTYAVYAWWTYHANRSTTVPYRIRHGGGTTTVTVNQRQAALGGQWNLLGTFTFAAGSSGYVEVSGAQGQASADAVWLGLETATSSGQ